MPPRNKYCFINTPFWQPHSHLPFEHQPLKQAMPNTVQILERKLRRSNLWSTQCKLDSRDKAPSFSATFLHFSLRLILGLGIGKTLNVTLLKVAPALLITIPGAEFSFLDSATVQEANRSLFESPHIHSGEKFSILAGFLFHLFWQCLAIAMAIWLLPWDFENQRLW